MEEINLTDADSRFIDHLRLVWEFNTLNGLRSTSTLLQGIIDDLTIIRVDPLTERGVWAYISVGAQKVPCEPRKEFFLISPACDDQHLQTLTEVVFRHAVPGNPLSVGDTFSLDCPWMQGSLCDCVLISRPYLYDPSVEFLTLGQIQIQFLWLFPITQQERDYLMQHGLEDLEQLFENHRVKPLDPLRSSVV